MHPPYFETPSIRDALSVIPSGKANCVVNELLDYKGQTLRHQIGHAKTAKPLQAPIYADTILGILEIVNLEDAEALTKSIPPKHLLSRHNDDHDTKIFEDEELIHD